MKKTFTAFISVIIAVMLLSVSGCSSPADRFVFGDMLDKTYTFSEIIIVIEDCPIEARKAAKEYALSTYADELAEEKAKYDNMEIAFGMDKDEPCYQINGGETKKLLYKEAKPLDKTLLTAPGLEEAGDIGNLADDFTSFNIRTGKEVSFVFADTTVKAVFYAVFRVKG